MGARERLREVFLHPPAPMECLLALMLVGWALLLSLPGMTYSYATARLLYYWSDELTWSAGLMIAGCVHAYAAFGRCYGLRRWMAGLHFVWWLYLAVTSRHGLFNTLDMATSAVLALASAWVYLRLRLLR